MKKNKKVSKKNKVMVKNKPTKKVSQELVIKVQPQQIPTVQDFLEPIHEGKKYSIEKTPFTIRQILSLVAPTPKEQVYTRPGKGDKSFKYVTGNWVEKKLNYTFGFLWDFEVQAHGREGDFIWIQGKLTVKLTGGTTISKTQFGRSEVKYLSQMPHKPENMIDFGNDLKSATTDCLKKCASLLGIASDIYGKAEYQQETGIVVQEARVISEKEKVAGPDGEPVFICSKCDGIVDEQVANYSKRMFGKILCKEDQKKK